VGQAEGADTGKLARDAVALDGHPVIGFSPQHEALGFAHSGPGHLGAGTPHHLDPGVKMKKPIEGRVGVEDDPRAVQDQDPVGKVLQNSLAVVTWNRDHFWYLMRKGRDLKGLCQADTHYLIPRYGSIAALYAASGCAGEPAFDWQFGDGSVSIGEVQKVVNGFLGLVAMC
jgi:hypothetical protein